MAANPDDMNDFYGADLGRTRALSAGAGAPVSSGGASPADPEGALPPGKYLIQAQAPSGGGASDHVFIDAVPFKKGDTAWNTMAAAAPATPLIRGWIEIHVRPGHNDRIVARTSAGSTTVYITQISRVPKKRPPA